MLCILLVEYYKTADKFDIWYIYICFQYVLL
jgi:hypothetical protein